LILSESVYGHSIMKGRVRITDTSLKPLFTLPFEAGVSDSTILRGDFFNFLISGGDDGIVFLYDLS